MLLLRAKVTLCPFSIVSFDVTLATPTVGGAIVTSPSKKFIEAFAKLYPGRASMSPILDVFITLLSLGRDGLKGIRQRRKEIYPYLHGKLEELAAKHGERLLKTKHNTISIAITADRVVLPNEASATESSAKSHEATFLGSMLFKRCVSGTRVVLGRGRSSKTIGPHTFQGWGSHANDYPHSYMTAAAAVGVSTDEVDTFIKRLDTTMTEFHKKQTKAAAPSTVSKSVLESKAPDGRGEK